MIRIATVEEAHVVFSNIPELERYLSIGEMAAKIIPGSLILVDELQGELVGFKIGYPLNEVEFYSWLGGVLPKYRKTGSAQKLLEFQEHYVREQGYHSLSVKSQNQFPSMLRLLIRNGYHITDVVEYGHKQNERICFTKLLNE
ncbi:GNAT family N-acetyltransferase [Aliivibrio kagoshimensis]|uniref:GNAT family N-acetyltransferase n=1 Tax=Aliivibrio kagoshimensis TaxID=2910230 RepID=UPI003D1336DF